MPLPFKKIKKKNTLKFKLKQLSWKIENVKFTKE